mgnify:FL=1|jgi:hypothetical protein|tara:strand:+ start:13774 stop:13977 length:204 start_codon:yes stop_codon:yes gene_type:complete
MADFVDPQFIDLILSRLNEAEGRLTETLISGSIETMEQYKVVRGQIEGLQMAKREITEVAEKTFTEI